MMEETLRYMYALVLLIPFPPSFLLWPTLLPSSGSSLLSRLRRGRSAIVGSLGARHQLVCLAPTPRTP